MGASEKFSTGGIMWEVSIEQDNGELADLERMIRVGDTNIGDGYSF